MTHVKFNGRPFQASINTFVDDLFTELPGLFRNDFNQTERKGFVPVNVKETEKGYTLEVVAPGFDKTDFKVNLDQNLLTISGEKKEEVKNQTDNSRNEKQVRREYSFRGFKRSFTLDEKIDATNIDAVYINGVLTLNLPKKEAVKPETKDIEIK